ncbi:uncharacterized protein UV8b_00918 [Ustilaginoidea virens]|uniref:Uncharacterized protein n=1 Tax=Ustilaginoidea virens TaxID=1159556 RepID=A0A8E5HJZ8_USTVR|nr:uncharacterized protein UV8b_00918 [Ustilaginoidea virens]QUC16677.1 hypothetical protein UV8b_00918 [Ustilaginoidea virens]
MISRNLVKVGGYTKDPSGVRTELDFLRKVEKANQGTKAQIRTKLMHGKDEMATATWLMSGIESTTLWFPPSKGY